MGGPILAICTSYDLLMYKEMPFRGSDVTAGDLLLTARGKSP